MPGGKQQHDEHAQPEAQQDRSSPASWPGSASGESAPAARRRLLRRTPGRSRTAAIRWDSRGRFHASSAPTVAKAAMNTTTTTSSNPFPPWLASFAGSG